MSVILKPELGTADFGADGVKILLTQIHEKTGKTYNVPQEYIFSDPEPISGSEAIIDFTHTDTGDRVPIIRNTKIYLSPLAVTSNYGSLLVYYNRINMAIFDSLVVDPTKITDKASVAKYLSKKTGYIIQEGDIDSFVLQDDAIQNAHLIVKASPTSLKYYSGSMMKLDFSIGTTDCNNKPPTNVVDIDRLIYNNLDEAIRGNL